MNADELHALRVQAEMVAATGMDKDWADTIDAGALAVCRAWLAEHPPTDDGEMETREGIKRAIPAMALEEENRSLRQLVIAFRAAGLEMFIDPDDGDTIRRMEILIYVATKYTVDE